VCDDKIGTFKISQNVVMTAKKHSHALGDEDEEIKVSTDIIQVCKCYKCMVDLLSYVQ